MVAILILAVAIAGLAGGVTTALDSSKESELQTTAAMLAAGRIEQLRAEGDISDGETTGDFGDAFPLYDWDQTITASQPDGLHEVDVVVENTHSGKPIYTLQTLLFEAPDFDNTNTTAGQNSGNSRRGANRQR